MANVDYGQIRQERIWVTRESVFNTQKQPALRDAVILRGRATLPSVLTDRVPSEEIRETPDIDQLINRKKPPGEFELPFYAKTTSTRGRLPQWANLLLNIMGVEHIVLEILSFTNLETNNNTVTVTIAGVPTVLTEDVEWQAGASNAAAATSLATAINALAGVGASAVGAEVLVTRDAGTGEVQVASNAPLADLSLKEIRYKLATDILEKSLTITHLADNILHLYRGCHASAAVWEVSGSDEGTLRFTGWLGNEVFCGYHTLATTLPDGAGTSVIVTEDLRTLVGPNADDVVYIKIENEEMKVTSVDYTTKTLTVVRGQNGTSAVLHTAPLEVAPVFPASDPDNNDTIIPMTLGTFDFGGDVHRIAEAMIGNDEQLEPRIDEWGEPALTGYRRPLEGRIVSMEFTAYQRAALLEILATAERGITTAVTVTIGKAGFGPYITLNLPKYQLMRPEKAERGGEFARVFNGIGLASSTPGNDGLNVSVRAA